MKKIVLKVDDMTCSACSSGLEKYLSKQNGVISANVNLVLSLASILYENVSIKDLENYIKEYWMNIIHTYIWQQLRKQEESENKTDKLISLSVFA